MIKDNTYLFPNEQMKTNDPVQERLMELVRYLTGDRPTASNEETNYDVKTDASNFAANTYTMLSIANVGGANGTLKGKTFYAGQTITFEAKNSKYLDAIDYSAVGTAYAIQWKTK
jgi:hypothetical protein